MEDEELMPRYESNPAHNPRAPLPDKTPEPTDAREVYLRHAVLRDNRWWGLGGNGEIYRFSPTDAGTVHFSGMTGGREGIRFEDIPIDVRRRLGRVR
jgi:hypothetical protein